MTILKNEPITASTIAVIIAWIAARFALDMDKSTVDAVALIVLAIGQWLARQHSTPVTKARDLIDQAFQADAKTAKKPTL